jgi:predicted CXXCH cytochrome family protein
MGARHWLLFTALCAGAWGCGASGDEPIARVDEAVCASDAPVGLSLFFQNGQPTPLSLLGSAPRFLQEIDITESVPSPTDDGIAPLIASSAVSALDWRGVTEVEEIWIPGLDGTFSRERYYRNARWMETSSAFTVQALDARGHAIGLLLVAHAGSDDHRAPEDDGFTRRFSARQIATGCASVDNCAGATFSAQALIQWRDALHPEQDARIIPPSTASLRLSFDQLPRAHYDVSLSHLAAGSLPFGYGFSVALEPLGAPANQQFYLPGESASFRVTFRDGQGNRLYAPGALPTYNAVLSRQDRAGLRYLDLQLQTRLYYALKHRESNLLMVLSGPTNKLKTPATVVDPSLLFGPQVPFATRAVDGFSAVGATIPSAAVTFGGFTDPSLWDLPVSDVVTFTIPADAEAGTYVAAVKARREFAGEALNRAGSVDIQVGQTQRSGFTPKTACTSCHSEERTQFSTLLHGIDDRRACFGCHSALGIEPDNVLDIRVHTIHDRSDRFGANVRNCSNCHLAAPAGPARGLLPPSLH